MTLGDWLDSGILASHTPSRSEITPLLAIVDRDLSDCRAQGLSPEWQLSIAYNAILQAATAALAAAGYRVCRREGGLHHTLGSLRQTVGIGADLVPMVDVLRRKRHLSDYARAGAVSQQEAGEAIALAVRLGAEVTIWLRGTHADLVE
ncbi:MAG: hypothetical protein AB1543_06695 [Candidatus Bipolaricaulota bacterium]